MNLYFLPTDIVFYILLLFFAFLAWQIARLEPLKVAWLHLWTKPLAVASFVILIFYVGIAFIDSIHFYNPVSGKIESVLDKMIAPAGQNDEKTYSAPFARVSLNQESFLTSTGKMYRSYPALEHVLQTPLSALFWARIFIEGLIESILMTGVLILVIWIGGRLLSNSRSYRYFFKNNSFRILYFTTFLLCWFALIIHHLLPYFHVMGTDKVGQDVFFETIKSVRTGIIIGSVTTLMMLPLAIFLGTAAGYFGGLVDDVIQYLYTTLSSIPGVLLIAASVLSLQMFIESHQQWFTSVLLRADVRLLALCIILGVTSWTGLCRLLRAETLKLRELDFVQAAQVLGTSSWGILIRHIIPNVFHVILITLVLDFSGLVLAEAVLSYVGVGVDPSLMSWGNMINSARLELARSPVVWWPLASAFVLMFILVLAANIFGDAVQEAFDPRTR